MSWALLALADFGIRPDADDVSLADVCVRGLLVSILNVCDCDEDGREAALAEIGMASSERV